jgi:tRNA G10  N-methylase Trm11
MLDPFCGYGAIPAARLKYFPCQAVYAADSDAEKVKTTREKLQAAVIQSAVNAPGKASAPQVPLTAYTECRQADFTKRDYFLPAASIKKLVTDPPWGIYDSETDTDKLYASLLLNCQRILMPGGMLVLLAARDTLLKTIFARAEYKGVTLRETYDILVSGKKACVLVAERF